MCCRTTLQKLEVRFCGNLQKKQSKNCVTFDETEMSLVIWLNIVTVVARSARLLSAHMRED